MKKAQNLCWNNVSDGYAFSGDKKREWRPEKNPPPSRNPFINFMRDFRKSNVGIGNSQLMKKGAEIWRQMNQDQKLLYFELAKSAQKQKDEDLGHTLRRSRRGRLSKKGRRSASRKRRKRAARSRTRSRSARSSAAYTTDDDD